MSNSAKVKEMYEAFGKGEIQTIIDQLADEVAWEAWSDNSSQRAGVPWFEPKSGKDGVAEFFAMVGSWEISEFEVLAILEGGNQVGVEVVIDAQPPEGGRFRDEELHLWTFDEEGKVTRMRHYTDTAKHIEAASVEGG